MANVAAAAVDRAQQRGISAEHWQHAQERRAGDDGMGYAALARHFGWALEKAFTGGAEFVIIVEDDLELARDALLYFAAMAPLLASDPTLLAVSAYADMGQQHNVALAGAVYRSDFFPGLGWMLHKSMWAELGPKWPTAYWDDWLREPAQRQGRHILRPEVSRSRTFGRVGVSRSQFFDQYLGNVLLANVPVDWLGDADRLSYLQADAFKASWDAMLAQAASMSSASALAQKVCQEGKPALEHARHSRAPGFSAGFPADLAAGMPVVSACYDQFEGSPSSYVGFAQVRIA